MKEESSLAPLSSGGLDPPPRLREQLFRLGGTTALLSLVVTAHYVAKPIRDAYLLRGWGSTSVGLLGLLILGLSVGIALLQALVFNSLGRRFTFGVIAAVTVGIYAVFPYLAPQSPRVAALALATAIALFQYFGLANAWALADSVSEQESLTRHYSVIGFGGPAGAVLGAGIAGALSASGRHSHMLIIAAALVILAFGVWLLIESSVPHSTDHQRAYLVLENQPDTALAPAGLRIFLGFSYTRVLLALLALTSLSGSLYKWGLARAVELQASGVEGYTQAFSENYLVISAIAFVAQAILTPLAFRLFSAAGTLTLLPIIGIGLAIAAFLGDGIGWLRWTGALYLGLDYTVNRCSREVMYVPTPPEVRFKAKAYLDSLGPQMGVLMGAVSVIALSQLFIVTQPLIAGTLCLVSGGWLATALLMRRLHGRLLQTHRDVSLTDGGVIASARSL